MMKDARTTSAQEVIQECFWGDYNLSAEDLLDKLNSGDPAFQRFLFSKIIDNSRHPSRHLRILFAPEQLHSLLQDYMPRAQNQKRARLVAANLTKNYTLAPEHQWRQLIIRHCMTCRIECCLQSLPQNKIWAVIGRDEPKDVFDLYAIFTYMDIEG